MCELLRDSVCVCVCVCMCVLNVSACKNDGMDARQTMYYNVCVVEFFKLNFAKYCKFCVL